MLASLCVAGATVVSACGGSPQSTSTTTTSIPHGVTVSACTFSQLRIALGLGSAGLGHVAQPIQFHNVSTTTCTLDGYPGVAALNAAGVQLAQALRTPSGYMGGEPTGVTSFAVATLHPGTVAAAILEGTDVPVGSTASTACFVYPAILVTPPNTTTSARLAIQMPSCSRIQVHPVIVGSSGQAPRA